MRNWVKQPVYEIRVQGHLEDRYLKWFEGMSFDYLEGDTLIVGPVPDQPALQGMLLSVGDFGLTLLSVRCLGAED